MDEFQAGSGAPNLRTAHSPHLLRIALLIAIIVAVLSVSYLLLVLKLPLPGVVGEYLAGLTFPQSLNGVTLVTETKEGSLLYRPGQGGFTKEALGASLVSATRDEAGSARITKDARGVFRVYLDGEVVIEDQYPRIGIARSPDGSRVAFAQALDVGAFISPADAPSLAVDRKRWEVVMYEPETRTVSTLGTGATPVFLDDTNIMWVAPAGLAIADLESGKTRVIATDLDGRIPAVSLVSPDRSIIGWYAPATKNIGLYKVTNADAEPQPLQVVTPPTTFRSLALDNEALYAVRAVPLGVEIVRQELMDADEVSVVRLPSSMRITRLLFGSI